MNTEVRKNSIITLGIPWNTDVRNNSIITLSIPRIPWNTEPRKNSIITLGTHWNTDIRKNSIITLGIPLNTEVKKITLGIPWTSCSWRWMWICC